MIEFLKRAEFIFRSFSFGLEVVEVYWTTEQMDPKNF